MVQTTSKAKPKSIQTSPRAETLLKTFKQLKSQRTNFESYWQSLHDYFYVESADINRAYYPGTELNVNALYDSTTLESADVLASGFMNYLTPPTSRWFSLSAKNVYLKNNKAISKYLDDVADQVNYTFNQSNFYAQMFPSFKSSGVYGTSCMIVEEDTQEDARFYSVPLRQVCLVEDGRGRVAEYYFEFEYTAYQAASRWGEDALSDVMKEELNKERAEDKKHKFLLFVANRHYRDITKIDKENLPIEAVWVDVENKKIMEESGYNEFPAMCHRFDKRPFIPWGFSPGMKALPFARILNAIAKTNLRAMMKHTDPPVALPQNAFIMPFNANPRAVNYYDKSKMDSGKDIFPFGNYGNPEAGMTAIEYYTNAVKGIMYNDTFLAFNSLTKQMNNPEVAERINEKMTLLGPSVGRYISEMLSPIIIRTIGILSRRGKLPAPPEEFLMSPAYEIEFTSQLAQAQRRSELNALVGGLSMVGQMAEYAPEVLDKIDPDKAVDEAWIILGSPPKVLRGDDEVERIREAKAEAAQKQAQMSMMQQGADVVEKGSKVDLNLAKAKE